MSSTVLLVEVCDGKKTELISSGGGEMLVASQAGIFLGIVSAVAVSLHYVFGYMQFIRYQI